MARIQLRFVTWIYLLWCFYHSLGLTYGEGQSTDDNKPRQLRISFGQSTREVVVLAATRANCSSSILYGDGLWNMKTNISGQTILFGAEQLNSKGLQFLHRFVLQNLNPGLTYLYHVKCNEEESELRGFKVPSNGTAWSPKFLVYGDLGVDPRIVPSLKEEVMSGEYTAVLHLGDFAYDLETDGGQKGDQFLDMIEPIASYIPYLTTPGNHEVTTDGNFIQYRYRFSTPTTTWPVPLTRMWYSMDIGPVHLISYNTEVFNIADKQYIALQHDWLITDLVAANTNREKVPWIVAIANEPFYCSNSDGHDCSKTNSVIRENLEVIFFQYSVDLVLNGHEHSYERLWPTNKGTVHAENYTNPTAPVTIISGVAGGSYQLDDFNSQPGLWSAFRIENGSLYSYGVLSVANKTHLHWEQKSVANNSILDSFWIEQSKHGEFVTVSPEEEAPQVTVGTPPPTGDAAKNENSFSQSAKKVVDKVTEIIKSNKPVAIGISSAVSVLLLIGLICVIVKCRRRKSAPRRWERLDYDKSFYSDVKTAEDDFSGDEGSELPTDGNGTLATSTLLSKSNV